jgi:RHS repeat-associated protein
VGNLTEVTNALKHNTSYTYDKNNNRVSFTNANGKVTRYGYDAVNRLATITDPLSFITSYGYDPVSNVISLTDANGKNNTFSYDNDNRLAQASYSDGSIVRYTYDADSNRTSLIDPHGTTSYVYDALDRVTSIVFPGSVGVQYTYDPVGNRSSLIYPDSSSLAFTYDADNRLSGVTDWLKRNTSYAYDPASNLTGITYPNAVASALTYDAANQLTGISDSANAVAYRVLAYAMDKVGNRTTVTDGGTATKYTYDAVNELLSSATGKVKSSWTYDPVGNRTKQVASSVTTNYTYDADDRMLTAGSTTFTYDNSGNRLTGAGSSGTTTYAYDANNRLLSVAAPTATSTFTYDGDGNRITQTTPAGTYNYVNDTAVALPVVLNEQGPDGAIDYSYGLGLTESSSSAFNYFYNLDGLGSVSNLTDSTGKVQETYSYDAWGNGLTATGSVGTKNKFRFTGQALDPATGLYFLRARYYDQTSGRLLSKDTFPGFAAQPMTLHRYTYAGNNPVNFVDPSGNFFIGGIVGFVVGSYHTSSFLGGVNGAIAGEFAFDCAEGTGFLGTAGCAAAGSVINDVLNQTFGVENISGCDVAQNALVNGVLGGALAFAPSVPGANPSTIVTSLTGSHGLDQWLKGIGNQAVSDYVGKCNEGAPPTK